MAAVEAWNDLSTGTDAGRAALPVLDKVPSRKLIDARALGWRDVGAALWRDDPVVEGFDTPRSDSQLVVLVTRGRSTIEVRRGARWHRELYGPGSLGLTAPGATSTLRWRQIGGEHLESLHVHVRRDLLLQVADDAPGRGVEFPDVLRTDHHQVRAAAQMLGWGLEHGAPPLYADAVAQVLAFHLVSAAADLRPPATAAQRGLSPALLGRLLDFMQSHLDQQISLDELGAVAHLSKYHLLRQFKLSTGLAPHQFLRRLRLERAAELLTTTSTPVSSVAVRCGYGSTSQFAAAFKRQHGVSPQAYRGVRPRVR